VLGLDQCPGDVGQPVQFVLEEHVDARLASALDEALQLGWWRRISDDGAF
jgi:hypothetical protein